MTCLSTIQCDETPFGEYVEDYIMFEEIKICRKSLFT